jgi:prepilin-type N-terminal cleavage/methylation domain-containing protein
MKKGFTLAELLIALAILGVIATFTIPKVLQSQQSAKSNAIAKEVAAIVSSAYANYRIKNTVDANTGMDDLIQFINYVKWDSGATVDDVPTYGPKPCSGGAMCFVLHNGAMFWYIWDEDFGGTATTNAIRFSIDPDGVYSGNSADGPSKSVQFLLYTDGKIRTWGSTLPNTYSDFMGPTGPNASLDPSWFSWN